jgi:hypothetical protein
MHPAQGVTVAVRRIRVKVGPQQLSLARRAQALPVLSKAIRGDVSFGDADESLWSR